ncbi:MAG: hypothetical protein M1546_15310 [Chloroflexi bacterium]|nr:hypothetical protein [Chloroflexota bacterium]
MTEKMHSDIDASIQVVTPVLDMYPGVIPMGEIAYHDPNGKLQPRYTATFTVTRDNQGWLTLEFLAWAINECEPRYGTLLPTALPPFEYDPGSYLAFRIEYQAPNSLAAWLRQALDLYGPLDELSLWRKYKQICRDDDLPYARRVRSYIEGVSLSPRGE